MGLISTGHIYFSSVLHNLVRDFPVFFGYYACVLVLTPSFYLTIMVQLPQSITIRGAKKQHPGEPALALRTRPMDITPVSVETREIVRCAYRNCRLVQYRTTNSLCRKCRRPLDVEEPVRLAPQLVTSQPGQPAEAGLQVATQVRDIRRARHLSQRQLAGRMQVPRTYISKIENGKAIPTLGSLERLAHALEVDVSQLVRDARSRREEEVSAIFNDPFLAEIAAALPMLDSLHRTLVMSAARDASIGHRRTA
jgi:transcriptional regulator with XRE-family HTH domain